MKLLLDQVCLLRYLLVSVLLLSLKCVAQTTDSVTDETIYPAPENWYQVEVILFTQQRNHRNEAPPKNYQLEFPENWVQLIDPKQPLPAIEPLILDIPSPSHIFPEAPNTELFREQFLLSSHYQQFPSTIQNNGDSGIPHNPVPEASIPYKYQSQTETDNISSDPLAEPSAIENIEQTAEVFVPEYEQPFMQLKALSRDLNESAAALDRRAYNVIFHQAWRFQASDQSTAPWIIIKAGPTHTDRYQLEGAIRFYQSRFLHFQANLWRLKFSNTTTNSLPLPIIPEKPLTPQQKVSITAREFFENLVSLGFKKLTDISNQTSDINTSTSDLPESYNGLGTSELHIEQPTEDDIANIGKDSHTTAEYPIETVWVMNKSQRLQEGDVYYLDHPEMGAFVTIKSYQPEPVNLPPSPNTDIEAEEETNI